MVKMGPRFCFCRLYTSYMVCMTMVRTICLTRKSARSQQYAPGDQPDQLAFLRYDFIPPDNSWSLAVPCVGAGCMQPPPLEVFLLSSKIVRAVVMNFYHIIAWKMRFLLRQDVSSLLYMLIILPLAQAVLPL